MKLCLYPHKYGSVIIYTNSKTHVHVVETQQENIAQRLLEEKNVYIAVFTDTYAPSTFNHGYTADMTYNIKKQHVFEDAHQMFTEPDENIPQQCDPTLYIYLDDLILLIEFELVKITWTLKKKEILFVKLPWSI